MKGIFFSFFLFIIIIWVRVLEGRRRSLESGWILKGYFGPYGENGLIKFAAHMDSN